MKLFAFIKRLFIKPKTQKKKYEYVKRGSVTDLKDNETNTVTKSSIEYNSLGHRLLKLQNTDCALVFHGNGKIQIVFTKLYDDKQQSITLAEQTLMSLAIFLKQPGFAQMIRHQFHNIANQNIKQLIEQENKK